MSDLIVSVTEHLVDRLTGPPHLRLIVQPFMAVLLAVIDGVHDAEERRPPYLWSLLTVAGHQRDSLRDAWQSSCKILVIALVLDAAYQLVTLRFIDVGEAIVVAFVLAIAPYVVFRGLVTRLVGGRRISA